MAIPAHKSVLSICSPVFFVMLCGEMAEKSGSINLPDCKYEGVLEMLRYMCSEEVKLSYVSKPTDYWKDFPWYALGTSLLAASRARGARKNTGSQISRLSIERVTMKDGITYAADCSLP